MKWAVIILLVIWFFCGIAGAWMLGDLDREHWKAILRGPITLVRAVNDSDAQYPWS